MVAVVHAPTPVDERLAHRFERQARALEMARFRQSHPRLLPWHFEYCRNLGMVPPDWTYEEVIGDVDEIDLLPDVLAHIQDHGTVPHLRPSSVVARDAPLTWIEPEARSDTLCAALGDRLWDDPDTLTRRIFFYVSIWKHKLMFPLLVFTAVATTPLFSKQECDYKKHFYRDHCCHPSSYAPDLAPWPEQAHLSSGDTTSAWSVATAEERVAFIVSQGIPQTREQISVAMGTMGYTVYDVSSTDGYSMNIFVKNEEKCKNTTVLEYYAGGNVIGNPLFTAFTYMKDIPNSCHVVPFVRNLFDTSTEYLTGTNANMQATIDDGRKAYEWTVDRFLKCTGVTTVCNQKFVVGGWSGGAQVATLVAKAVYDKGAVHKADEAILISPQISCRARDTPSMLRTVGVDTMGIWHIGTEETTWSAVTDEDSQCPENFGKQVYESFADRYILSVSQHDGFKDSTIEMALRLQNFNIAADLYVGKKVSHSTDIVVSADWYNALWKSE